MPVWRSSPVLDHRQVGVGCGERVFDPTPVNKAPVDGQGAVHFAQVLRMAIKEGPTRPFNRKT